jgi:hypothetical protein
LQMEAELLAEEAGDVVIRADAFRQRRSYERSRRIYVPRRC